MRRNRPPGAHRSSKSRGHARTRISGTAGSSANLRGYVNTKFDGGALTGRWVRVHGWLEASSDWRRIILLLAAPHGDRTTGAAS